MRECVAFPKRQATSRDPFVAVDMSRARVAAGSGADLLSGGVCDYLVSDAVCLQYASVRRIVRRAGVEQEVASEPINALRK